MRMFVDAPKVYLHREPVDFRKQINGLSVIVQEALKMDPFEDALFVFINCSRNRIKALYWERNGFCLWFKRLEKDKFSWPKHLRDDVVTISEQKRKNILFFKRVPSNA